MGSTSKIEWCHATWSPVRARLKPDVIEIAQRKGYDSLVQILTKRGIRRPDGELRVGPHCEKVSPGCTHCYSETNNSRCLPHNGTGLPFDRRSRDLVDVFVDEKILTQPLHWNKPRIIFVCSQTDLYGEFVNHQMIDQVKAVEALCPQHFFLELTKRSKRALEYPRSGNPPTRISNWAIKIWMKHRLTRNQFEMAWPMKHVGLGVSPHDQESTDRMIPDLLQTSVAMRYVSYEPALSTVDWTCVPWPKGWQDSDDITDGIDPLRFTSPHRDHVHLDWLIAGGESGPHARPSHPDWFRDARDQCQKAGVAFLFKQWGEWAPASQVSSAKPITHAISANGIVAEFNQEAMKAADPHCTRWEGLRRLGKKSGGRKLDDREWNEFPRQIVEHFERQGIEIGEHR